MCGVIGLIYERERADLGQIAGELLRTLEYRGYDSTGAAIQGAGEEIDLRKDVGAPSAMVHRLGIVKLGGQILCGQVRWATFGAVDRANSQPHEVRCRTHIYGAHNGNVTNCDELQAWLRAEGHQVLSDNDGEMVVHTVEHFFAERMETTGDRRTALRAAVIEAGTRLKGSFAAVVVDPKTRTLFAIKRGSSLYFGVGEDEIGGKFAVASSDLSAVLKLTRTLVPLVEGELVELDATSHQVYAIDGTPRERKPIRSKLRAKDTGLSPPFQTFMEQEIDAQEGTSRDVVRIFSGGSEWLRELTPALERTSDEERAEILRAFDAVQEQLDDPATERSFRELSSLPAMRALIDRLPVASRSREPELVSQEKALLGDLLPIDGLAARILDAMLERAEIAEANAAISALSERCLQTLDRGGRIYLVCCGTSFHAAKAACLFFNDLAGVEVLALLPGEFRGQYAACLRPNDLFIGVSQSGETKDLIDVVNLVIETGLPIGRVALVNNVNSTLAQEKSELVIPLRCGPEIAVPATKSFINQLTIFYCLAVRFAERRGRDVRSLVEGWGRIPELIRSTIEETDAKLEEAAELLYLAPSMHLLGTRLYAVAKEGALKLREVVLSHTEGFEGSEFKHGPNTILGRSTVYGARQVESLLSELARQLERAKDPAALVRSLFDPALATELDREAAFSALHDDYPLVYITGPDPRDVALTVSQINTHKIRGASTVVIAEEHPALRGAAMKPPAGSDRYRAVYVALPPTGDTLMTVFTATVALQRLALEMSLRKMAHLDRIGLTNHGVHPDVPKNVSKSITVD
jgi:glucosamine 6-phosphate synthetase-like amidotransferase/phosphosugar isomerase protein